ncbi:rho GTPase-activating protein 33-like, partial [Chiloscyllium plagiosum]|uniref:rho GTPase-activating protein 33-like n=1 Tax=Chiloscyllium plagiosum TaxID=36176 RepID=UPI001CB7CDD5
MRHLGRLAQHSAVTNMHIKNLAIVWAPNLLRSKEIESVGFTGTDAFQEVRIQSIVVEFLLRHVDILFSDTFSSAGKESSGKGQTPSQGNTSTGHRTQQHPVPVSQ